MRHSRAFLVLVTMVCALFSGNNGGSAWSAVPERAVTEGLSLEKVTLFNNGVGYFQFQGHAPAGKSLYLHVKRDQMNDLIKSLTIINRGHGQVSSIVYDNARTADQKLGEFDFKLEKNQGLPEILRQFQGSRITLRIGPNAVSGDIMGVEERNIRQKDILIPAYFLSVLDEDGQLRSFNVQEITGVRLQNQKLNQDIKRYLKILFQKHQKEEKTVMITPSGEGSQEILVSYVAETPVWKATYRIVLPDEGSGKKPFLQGWAIIDNVSGEDWKDVTLSLVSGLPISFVYDLYAPRFRKRPKIATEAEAPQAPALSEAGMGREGVMRVGAPAAAAAKGKAVLYDTAPKFEASNIAQRLRDIKAQTVTREVGDMFEYQIDHPVTVEQNQSAMVPIVTGEIEGLAVDLYNEKMRKSNPLAGVKMKNITGLTLEGGTLTVIHRGTYAGEALMQSLKPNEKRYITYAVDLGLRVNTERGSTNEPVARVIINRGVMRMQKGIVETKTYTLDNQNAHSRTVIIEHPYRTDWKLVEPDKPIEVTDRFMRFEVQVPAHTKRVFKVVETRTIWDSISVRKLTPDDILVFSRKKYFDPNSLTQLQKIAGIKAELAALEKNIREREKERENIFSDQERIRKNLRGLGQTTEEKGLRSRYIQQLNQQEDRLGRIADEENSARMKKQEKERDLDKLLEALTQDVRF